MARKIVIMGLGLFGGGLAAAKYFSSLHENVYVTDLRKAEELQESLSKLKDYPITYCLGKHNEDDFKDADLIIVNPGVPESSKFLNIAREHGVPIDTEINIVLRKIPAKVIGITGSNGKSTTTAMIHHILQYHGYKVWLGGNIGHSLLSDIDTIKKDDIVVLELSSFQLERLNKSPHIAVITNFSKNHLDRHKTMENYAKAKQNIFRYQESDGICILNGNDAALMKWIPDIPGKYKRFGLESDVFIEDQAIFANIEGKKGYIINIKDLPLSGRANYENAMAAILAVLSFNKTLKNIDKALMTFQGLPHRMELVGIYNGCKIYNDSDATTAESTIAAITSVPPPIILIAGGSDKGINYRELGSIISQRVKKLILMGDTADKIAENVSPLNVEIIRVDGLEEAIKISKEVSSSGDSIILSPASASFGMFRNFAERGKMFQKFVQLYFN